MDIETETVQVAEGDSGRKDESFTRETSPRPLGDLSSWDDQAVLAGMRAECGELRSLDANFPSQYHRLGMFIIESGKRIGEDTVRQMLRQEGIDNTKAWRAEQIATLYTYDQAAAFPSLRAILGTLPVKQPRKKRPALPSSVSALPLVSSLHRHAGTDLLLLPQALCHVPSISLQTAARRSPQLKA